MSANIRVAELDFDLIKENFKTYLRSKPEFTDYDFEGSGLSVIMDLLAYNTHYNAVIANMLVQELYLDTAVKKESLSLIAKRLGYTPKSYVAPRATVSLEVFPSDNPTILTLGKNAAFSAQISTSGTATFVTKDAYVTTKDSNNRYIFNSVDIYEGNNYVYKYIYDSSTNQRFEIPSKYVDLSLLKVYIQDSISGTSLTEWKRYDTLIDISSDTLSFFIKLNESLNYEIYFGDGIIGKSIIDGNVIVIDYVTTNGDLANGASKFSFTDTVNGYGNTITNTITPAFGGALPESLDSIRKNAQNQVLTQNRAITEKDYATIIANITPLETISVYGGESMLPPVYGKVFISAKQFNTTLPLTYTQKEIILTDLRKRAPMAITHEFIDPEYIYLTINTEVAYNATKTANSPSSIKLIIFNAIKTYAASNLNTFNSTFQYSKLVGYIDTIDTSIVSNDTEILLTKNIIPIYNISQKYVVTFFTEIKQSNSKEFNVTSSGFYMDGYANLNYIYDSNGMLYTYYMLDNAKVLGATSIGTIDYSTGTLTFNVNLTNINNGTISLTVVPNNKNIIPSRNNIITLNDTDIHVTLKAN